MLVLHAILYAYMERSLCDSYTKVEPKLNVFSLCIIWVVQIYNSIINKNV